MLDTMTERIRMIFDTEERYRRAVKLYAARHGISTSEVVNKALEDFCAQELEEVSEIIAREQRQQKKPPRD